MYSDITLYHNCNVCVLESPVHSRSKISMSAIAESAEGEPLLLSEDWQESGESTTRLLLLYICTASIRKFSHHFISCFIFSTGFNNSLLAQTANTIRA